MSLFHRIRRIRPAEKAAHEIAEELDSHIQMRTADHIADGMSQRKLDGLL